MSDTEIGDCPICNKKIPIVDIEKHVNKCLFLNVDNPEEKHKRKRSPSKSPGSFIKTQQKISSDQKSPRDISANRSQAQNKRDLAPLFQKNTPSTSKLPEINEIKESEEKIVSFTVPLAKQVQPKSLEDFFGQDHVLGKNTLLHSLIEKGEIINMILWGPPGCGKTSLANIIHEYCKKDPKKLKFVALCAATCGIKDVQTVISAAKGELKFGRKTILFMDEIHRFNKKQQDTFLLSVEKGDIILLGATTENPSFSINSALLSRCRVIVMEKLSSEHLYSILVNAAEKLSVDVIDTENPCGVIDDDSGVSIEETALKWLADISDGDARIALGNLQLAVQHFNQPGKIIKIDDIKDSIKNSHMLYDRKGEEHYNIISAMHKSIRGSDPNAALYWTTRMIVSGEDPMFIARRLVRAASEDIGNADPTALPLAVSTMQGCHLLGMPEADVLLAQCAIYLARAPKSREADSALAEAKRLITSCKGPQPAVPMHIRNAPTRLMKDLGYGKIQNGYCSFMPPELKDVNFF